MMIMILCLYSSTKWSTVTDWVVVFALFVFMLALLCFCVATAFSMNKDLYIIHSGVGTMGTGGTLYPPSSGLVTPVPSSQRCGLCQNFKQTTLTTRLYKVRTNLYPPTYENVPTRLIIHLFARNYAKYSPIGKQSGESVESVSRGGGRYPNMIIRITDNVVISIGTACVRSVCHCIVRSSWFNGSQQGAAMHALSKGLFTAREPNWTGLQPIKNLHSCEIHKVTVT